MIAFVLGVLLAAERNGGVLLILGPLGGAGVYLMLFRYYRNTDKSHAFESETRITAQPITGSDVKVDEIKGTRRSEIEGDNHKQHRKRVQRVT